MIDLEGFFTSELPTNLQNYVKKVLESDPTLQGVLINFERIDHVDSRLIGIMVSIFRLVEKHKSKLGLCGLNQSNQKIFQLSGLEQILKIYPNEEMAIDQMTA